MAMTYQDERKKQQTQQAQPAQTTGGYNLQGTSETTQQNLARAQQGYQPSETVQQAQARIQQVQGLKPQTYNSKYSAALENILQQIQNPGEFKYEFNGDNQFKYLADMFQQMGKQASLDAQGQAAALTGGYGNSYGLNAGAQAYQQYLLGLYDKGIDLQGQAYQRYADRQANQYNQLAALQGADDTAYARSRDEMADWEREADRAQNAYESERNFDYNAYADALQNAMKIGQMETEGYRADQDEAFRQAQLAEQIRATAADEDYRNRTLDWNMETDARDYAEAVRRADADENYRQQQFNEQVRQNDLDEAYRQNAFNEQVRQANLDEAYRQQTFGEQVRQNDLDEAYRQQAFGEQVRQANLDEQYRRDSLAQNQAQFEATTNLDWAQLAEKQREYDAGLSEEQRQYNTKNAIAMCTDILANGQIPSNDLLIAAGLSYEDAQKLIATVGGSGGTGGTKLTAAQQLATMQGVTTGAYGSTGLTGGLGAIAGNYEQLAETAEQKAASATNSQDKKNYEEIAKKYRKMLDVVENAKK